MFGSRIGGVLACVALIDVRDLDRLTGLGLHSLGEFGDSGAFLLVRPKLLAQPCGTAIAGSRDRHIKENNLPAYLAQIA